MAKGLGCGVGLPAGIRRRVARPSIWRRFARAVDKVITRAQEWLEGRDRDIDKVVANLIICAAVIYLAASVAEIAGGR